MVKDTVHTARVETTRTLPASFGDLAALSDPLEALLAAGGDPRLDLDPVRMLNRYGCRPWPRPEAFAFASSTAANVSYRGFAAAAAMRERLLRAQSETELEHAGNEEAEWLRDQIRNILELVDSGVEIVFSPSGTDSEVHALYVARTILGGSIVNVIVAADETGSGVADASSGCHFSSATAQGAEVLKGKRIPGFADDITSIEIPVRAADETLRSDAAIDREVTVAVAHSVASGKGVILHVMDSSKFGWRGPSLHCLHRIQENCGRSVQIVVDACQLRLGRQRLRHYLERGFMVLITGSKYFTGPPFSGALLVPAVISAEMEQTNAVPLGLKLYANRNDWPVRWQGIRSQTPARPNIGQLLRWSAALEELHAYFAIPASYRSLALQMFSSTAQRLIAARPNLRLLPGCDASFADALDDEEMSARTIFPFLLRRRGKLLSLEACGRVYRALNCDMSHLLAGSATAEQLQVAVTPCQTGQPVSVLDPLQGVVGTLRISAGARVVSDSWSANGKAASLRKLNQEFDQLRVILDKIDLLVENLGALGDIAPDLRTESE